MYPNGGWRWDFFLPSTFFTNDVPFSRVHPIFFPSDLMNNSQVDYVTIPRNLLETRRHTLSCRSYSCFAWDVLAARDISTTPLKRLALQLFPTYAAWLLNIQQNKTVWWWYHVVGSKSAYIICVHHLILILIIIIIMLFIMLFIIILFFCISILSTTCIKMCVQGSSWNFQRLFCKFLCATTETRFSAPRMRFWAQAHPFGVRDWEQPWSRLCGMSPHVPGTMADSVVVLAGGCAAIDQLSLSFFWREPYEPLLSTVNQCFDRAQYVWNLYTSICNSGICCS